MPLFRSALNHNGMSPGEVVEIPDAEVGRWEGEIEAGFLMPVQVPSEIERAYYAVGAESVPESVPEGDADTGDDAAESADAE